MPNDRDLFVEEQTMVAMSFGDHLEELRARIILALVGLLVGMIITLIPLPSTNIGWWVMNTMEAPARETLEEFYKDHVARKAKESTDKGTISQSVQTIIEADLFIAQLKELAPSLNLPDPESVKGKTLTFPIRQREADLIKNTQYLDPKSPFISLSPLETITIFMMVCMISGLVLASPWVFYQAWAFVAAGLYRHERHYVVKFLPMSLGLFLGGVFLCFFGVLPVTLKFLLQFNVWLNIEPTMRITDWMSFATVLPLVFGACFQTPLIMLFLERIGIMSAEDFRSKRKIAVLIMVVAAAVLTPGPDIFSQVMLAVPMIALYELGILLIDRGPKRPALLD